MTINKALFSSEGLAWETPLWFFEALHDEFNFTCDVCADIHNRKVDKFFSIQQDAFKLQWKGVAYCNPPYGRDIGRWFEKAMNSAIDHGTTVVILCPVRCDTNWWFDYARLGEVRLLKGRLRFEGAPSSAPFPSALVIFRPGLPHSVTHWNYTQLDVEPFYTAFQYD